MGSVHTHHFLFDVLWMAAQKLALISTTTLQTNLTQHLHSTTEQQYRTRFLISKGDELVVIHADDILYIVKEVNRILAFTDNNTSYPLSLSMTEVEQSLTPDKFFRINRQYIANIKGIKRISVFFGSKLSVRLKVAPTRILLSVRRKAHC